MIGGNYRTGFKGLKANLTAKRRAEYYSMWDPTRKVPFVQYERTEKKWFLFAKLLRRSKENAMRGIKLNKKKGGIGRDAMAAFNRGKGASMRSRHEVNKEAEATSQSGATESADAQAGKSPRASVDSAAPSPKAERKPGPQASHEARKAPKGRSLLATLCS